MVCRDHCNSSVSVGLALLLVIVHWTKSYTTLHHPQKQLIDIIWNWWRPFPQDWPLLCALDVHVGVFGIAQLGVSSVLKHSQVTYGQNTDWQPKRLIGTLHSPVEQTGMMLMKSMALGATVPACTLPAMCTAHFVEREPWEQPVPSLQNGNGASIRKKSERKPRSLGHVISRWSFRWFHQPGSMATKTPPREINADVWGILHRFRYEW